MAKWNYYVNVTLALMVTSCRDAIMRKIFVIITMLGCFALDKAYAETNVDKKLFQFGGPETRTRCIKELKTKGVPACTVKGFEVTCDDTWIVACTEWATDFMQHEYFLVVTGPDAPDALKQTLTRAVEHALTAAIAAAVATPGEITARSAAAIATFKVTFAADLAVEPILAGMKDQFHLSLRQESHW